VKHPDAKRFAFDLHHTGQRFGLARFIAGPVVAEVVVPPLDASDGAPFSWRAGITDTAAPFAFNTAGPRSVVVTISCTGGGSVVLRPMVLDQEAAAWLDLAPGGLLSPTLSEGDAWELTTYERTALFVIDDIAGAVADLEILIAPGRTYG